MHNEKNIKVIEKIIILTKERKIKWYYLDSKYEIYQGMDWIKTKTQVDSFFGTKEKEYLTFDTENSFFTRIKNTYIVIKSPVNSPASLYIIPETFKKVVVMPAGEYGEYITRLLNLVNSQFPNARDFIDDFLDD